MTAFAKHKVFVTNWSNYLMINLLQCISYLLVSIFINLLQLHRLKFSFDAGYLQCINFW